MQSIALQSLFLFNRRRIKRETPSRTLCYYSAEPGGARFLSICSRVELLTCGIYAHSAHACTHTSVPANRNHSPFPVTQPLGGGGGRDSNQSAQAGNSSSTAARSRLSKQVHLFSHAYQAKSVWSNWGLHTLVSFRYLIPKGHQGCPYTILLLLTLYQDFSLEFQPIPISTATNDT